MKSIKLSFLGWEKSLFILITIISLGEIKAQEASRYSFSLLRQNDTIDSLIVSPKNDYEKAKVLSFSDKVNLSWGGSSRWQYEQFTHENFDKEESDFDNWVLHRFLFHTDLKIGKSIRLFSEINSALVWGKDNRAPVDMDRLEFNQLFLEFSLENVKFTLGRQNLMFGGRRLIDVREGPNVRQSFDLASIEFNSGNWNTTLLYAVPLITNEGFFDNEELHGNESIWGVYTVKQINESKGYDLYYLGFREENKSYHTEFPSTEVRHSVGARLWGTKGRLSYNHESLIQLGSFGEQSIFGWTISFDTKYQLRHNQKLGLKTELISGDNEDNSQLRTFNPLYPRGAYFGRVAKFGPANLIDIHPSWSISAEQLRFEIDYDAFWRFSTSDGVYGPAVTPDFSAESDERFIGHQFGTIFTWEPNQFFVAELETNYIIAGDYLKEVTAGNNLFHVVITLETKF